MVNATDPIVTAGALIRFTRALNARLRATEGEAGLTLAELNVLAGIDKGQDLSSALARALVLDPPRVSRIVEGFVASSYLTRSPDPDDRRRSRLQLTPAGSRRLEEGRAALTRVMEDLLSDLTDDERAGLQRAVPGLRRAAAGHVVYDEGDERETS